MRLFNRRNIYACFYNSLECENKEQRMTFHKEICGGMRQSDCRCFLAAKFRFEKRNDIKKIDPNTKIVYELESKISKKIILDIR